MRTGLITIVASLMLAACGNVPGTLIILNRTMTPVAVGPGLTLPACSETAIPMNEFSAARNNGVNLAHSDDEADADWVPEGAVEWGPVALHGDGFGTYTVILSGTAPLKVVNGRVNGTDLPPCVGEPDFD